MAVFILRALDKTLLKEQLHSFVYGYREEHVSGGLGEMVASVLAFTEQRYHFVIKCEWLSHWAPGSNLICKTVNAKASLKQYTEN